MGRAKIIDMNPPDAGSLFHLGKVHRGEGRWPEAEAALHQALELAPQNGWAHLELGTLYLDQSRFSEAEVELKKAAAIDGNHGGAYCQLGRIYHRQGRWLEAETELHKALSLDPRDGAAYIELGVLYLDQGRILEAAAAFEKLGMTQTAQRNGVLFYFVPEDRRFAVIGDTGIHEKCGPEFWSEVAAALRSRLAAGEFTEAILEGIRLAGETLASHFPRRPGDRNKLPDSIVSE